MIVFYIILAILLFGVLILVHEFGHFITAKLFGVQVNEFALFMGPAIFKKTKGETTYSLRCIPIGGYCAMEGENGDSDNPRAFTRAKVWQRLIILVAGAFMNLVVGFLIVVILAAFIWSAPATTTVASVEAGRPFADRLQPGDELYRINGERVYIDSDITMLLDRSESGVQDLVVLRDGEKVTLNDVPLARDFEDASGALRYGFGIAPGEKTVGSVLSYSWYQCVDFARMVRMGLQDLFSGRAGIDDMGGPVQVVTIAAEQGAQASSVGVGVSYVLWLFAFIAVNLAVMNLLPIPALDGGRAVCLLLTAVIEKIIRRKLNPKYEGYLHAGFMVLLLGFMAFITFKDIIKLF